MRKSVKNLKPGDKTDWYKVIKVEVKEDKVRTIVLFFSTKTVGRRTWTDPNCTVQIRNSLPF